MRPIRHRIASSEGPAGDLTLDLRVRESNLAIAGASETPIQEVFRLLVDNEARTAFICDDVIEALNEGRRCLVLSQWTEHCHLARRRSSRPRRLAACSRRKPGQARPRRDHRADRDQPARRATRHCRDRPVPRRRLRLAPTRRPLPRVPRLVQRPPRPVHRTTHARRRRQDNRPRLRLRRQPRASATRDAHTTAHHLQVARIHPRAHPVASSQLPVPILGP